MYFSIKNFNGNDLTNKMMMIKTTAYVQTDLSRFTIGDYSPGPKLKVVVWYLFNYFIMNSSLPWPYSVKVFILRLFGAGIGKKVVIKARVRIKYPWRLTIGDHSWLGEDVWIDNLEMVKIGSNVCLSQGAMLLTGNHDYRFADFPYRLGKIHIMDGAWIGAKAVVCPGITCKEASILTVNSVATKNLEPMGIYTGNPAILTRHRKTMMDE